MAAGRDALTEVFAALAHPTRRDILDRLAVEPHTVGELASTYDVSGPAISQHLKVLERSGLISREVRQQWRTCSLNESGFDEAVEWIARHHAEWNERFDLLDERIRSKRKDQR